VDAKPADLVTASPRQVFAERDPAVRRETLAKIFAADVVFRDAEGEAHGHAELEAKVAGLLAADPTEWVFRESAAPAELGDLARVSWTFGPPAGPPVVTGTDIAFVVNGQIQRMYTFLD
jgi:SnoaL-like domain